MAGGTIHRSPLRELKKQRISGGTIQIRINDELVEEVIAEKARLQQRRNIREFRRSVG